MFHLLLGRVYDDKDVQERIVRNSIAAHAQTYPTRPVHIIVHQEVKKR